MDDLLGEFLAETREMLTAIGGELVAWEADPCDRARLDAIFRFVHTVKGNCGFFDFPRLEALSHGAEDALAEVRAGRRSVSPRLVTAVLAIIDRIAIMVDAIEAGEELPARGDDVLLAALEPDSNDAADLADDNLSDNDGAHPARVSGSAQRSIRLPVGLLDGVMGSVSDLVLARNDLARRLRDAGVDPSVHGPFERLSTILDQVREAVTRMRMQRIEHLFGALPRLVRDLSAELGKQVMIDLEGADVELDREMIEMIRDPLTHIIRNAIDHGIERPSERLAAGKREIGTLHIAARQSGNRIMISISDDGRGIDGARLVDKAIAAGALSRADAETLGETGRHSLIFEPGLSTAQEVTSVSGRGVGMDVVRANIERVGGTIEVGSTPGEGTRIGLSLPLTLSIIPSLTVGAGGHLFALPRSSVEEIVHGGASHIDFARAGDRVLVTVRGRRVACLSLAGQLGLPDPADPEASTLVLIRLAHGELFALAVDRVFDHEELVIKPLAPAVMATGIYAGSTLLDDGHPVLMLDITGIARKARLLSETQRRSRVSEEPSANEAARGTPALLFVGLGGTRKLVRLGTINRIERVSADAADLSSDPPRVVIGDALFPLAGVDGALPDHGQLSVLRLGDGGSEIAYAIDRIIDTVELVGEIAPARTAGAAEGTALVDGLPAEVLDTHWLFAGLAAPSRAFDPPLCRLPANDPWARTILAPLVESVGYKVVDETFGGTADVAIETEGGSAATGERSVIKLCSDPAQAEQLPGALYRYDRAGLIAALSALRSGRAAA
ncbi:chemotaxis protein CheA [Altererythrobacter sp. TH136]|uniref:chemotaxis protein CheA n=1 Tax=Altererythrobacter sp. TH136 TaxID=2067415 RepID=UPI001163E5DF|nr:chemotaxis protein CheA [Altererythrobacter sp. TH136]QDM41360.1 chemotaxis protein CheA [Altererythrobacter sp. TH136]